MCVRKQDLDREGYAGHVELNNIAILKLLDQLNSLEVKVQLYQRPLEIC
jgi:hypothetical protein